MHESPREGTVDWNLHAEMFINIDRACLLNKFNNLRAS